MASRMAQWTAQWTANPLTPPRRARKVEFSATEQWKNFQLPMPWNAKLREKTIGMCVCVYLYIERERWFFMTFYLGWSVVPQLHQKATGPRKKSPQERPWPFPPPSPLRDAIVSFFCTRTLKHVLMCFDVCQHPPFAQPNHRFPQRLQLKVPATFPFPKPAPDVIDVHV